MFRVIARSYAMRIKEFNNVYLIETNNEKKKMHLYIDGRDYFDPIVLDLRKYKYISVVG